MMKYIIHISTLIATLFSSSLLQAMDIHVTKFNDTFDGVCDSDCSLREAVQFANTNPGPDRILLKSGTYILEIPPVIDTNEMNLIVDEDGNLNGDLDIHDDVIIHGANNRRTTIDGLKNHRILETLSGTTELIKLTLTNGMTSDYGGGIENHATLTLRYCTVENNLAKHLEAKATGGGIANFGNLFVYSSVITGNRSTGSDGIVRSRGPGGGIYNEGNLIVRDSTISHNSVHDGYEGVGGGLFNSGTADVRRTLFYKNKAGFFGNASAAITAKGGVLKMVNTTVSGHTDGAEGEPSGAVANGVERVFSSGILYLTNVTITDNNNHGLTTSGQTYVKNSIISGNGDVLVEEPKNCLYLGGVLEIDNVILGSDDGTCYGNVIEIPNDDTFITLLEPLADNGGPTLTHAVKESSVAVDAGVGPCNSHDQRGMASPTDGDNNGIATCDIGAFEYHPDADSD